MSDSTGKLPFGAASAYADAMEAGKSNMMISCELVIEMTDALERSQQENERLRKANQDCVEWEKACKADLDRALARVAELEGRVCRTCDGHGMIGGPSYAQPDEGGEPCPECSGFLLRKQAEAVEAARDELCDFRGELWNAAQPYELTDYATRLRQQADELERQQ